MTTTAESKMVVIGSGCPAWCEHTGHHADVFDDDNPRRTTAPTSAPCLPGQAGSLHAMLCLGNDSVIVSDPEELRQIAVDGVLTAEWREGPPMSHTAVVPEVEPIIDPIGLEKPAYVHPARETGEAPDAISIASTARSTSASSRLASSPSVSASWPTFRRRSSEHA